MPLKIKKVERCVALATGPRDGWAFSVEAGFAEWQKENKNERNSCDETVVYSVIRQICSTVDDDEMNSASR